MSKDTPNLKRRNVLKLSAASLLGSVVGAKVVSTCFNAVAAEPAKSGTAAGPLEMVKESDPQAKALGYYEDSKKVDVKKWPKRAGAEGAKQFCYNCQFYQTTDKNPKATKSAPCQILAMKGVTANGWCNTWTLNPKVSG